MNILTRIKDSCRPNPNLLLSQNKNSASATGSRNRHRRLNHDDPKQKPTPTTNPANATAVRVLVPLHRSRLLRLGILTTLLGAAFVFFHTRDETQAVAEGTNHSHGHIGLLGDKTHPHQDHSGKKHLHIRLYRLLPLRTLSRTWGWFFSRNLPHWSNQKLLSWFVRSFNVNMEEAKESDLTKYRSLAELFGRELKEGVRPVSQMSPLVSPCDGVVLKFHRIPLGEELNQHQSQQIGAATLPGEIKGVLYPVESFFGISSTSNGDYDDDFLRQELLDSVSSSPGSRSLQSRSSSSLYCCIVYLGPGNYHRFHSPVNWALRFRRHFHGELMSVHPSFARRLPEVFHLNERVIYTGRWEYGFFSMAAVGATNVGSIQVYHDKELVTNVRTRRRPVYAIGSPIHTHTAHSHAHKPHDDAWFIGDSFEPYQDPITNEQKLRIRSRLPIRFRKGEPFGQFNLGSTIVLIFQAPSAFESIFADKVGKVVKYGETLL